MRSDSRARQFDPRHKGFDDSVFTHGLVRGEEVFSVTRPIPAGATLTLANIIPANIFLLGVVARVIDEVFGATGALTDFDIGDGTTVNLWGDAISPLADTRTDSSNFLNASAGWRYTVAAENVVLTANGENFAGGGIAVSVLLQSLRGQRRRGA